MGMTASRRGRMIPQSAAIRQQVVEDIWSGASLRELAASRDDLACANARYAGAVRGARAESNSLSILALRIAWPPRSLLK